jgi:1-acyl-sn-glycerol-3-phosphate acyltransferase
MLAVEQLDRIWRVAATGFAFALFGLGALCLSLFLGADLLLMRIGPATKIRVVRHAIATLCSIYLRTVKGLGLLTYECDDFAQLDCRGKLIVANHPTLLDAVFLMAMVPNATFVAKAAMTRHFFTGGIARLAGYIANDQEGVALLDGAKHALLKGDALVIFPEGTRTNNATPKFKRGAANIAIAAGCNIVPVRISCNPPALRKNQKWYDVPPRKPHFMIGILPEITPRHVIDTERPIGVQARQLTQYLQNCLTQVEPAGGSPANSSLGI